MGEGSAVGLDRDFLNPRRTPGPAGRALHSTRSHNRSALITIKLSDNSNGTIMCAVIRATFYLVAGQEFEQTVSRQSSPTISNQPCPTFEKMMILPLRVHQKVVCYMFATC